MRWRYKHVGAPDNRIKEFPLELVLTPWGRDMIPELGLGSRHPTENKLTTFPNFQQHFIDYFSLFRPLIAKDGIEIDRRLWRKFESLALYLANKWGHHLCEKLPAGGPK